LSRRMTSTKFEQLEQMDETSVEVVDDAPQARSMSDEYRTRTMSDDYGNNLGLLTSLSNRLNQAREELEEGHGPYPEPAGKPGQMKYGCESYDVEPTEYLATLQQDLASTHYWSGNFLKDWIFFIAQLHPLLGIFTSHPYHPWTKTDRVKMFIISTSLTMIPAIMVMRLVEHTFPKELQVTLGKFLGIVAVFVFVGIPDLIINKVLRELSLATGRYHFLRSVQQTCMKLSFCIGITACCFAYLYLKDHQDGTIRRLKPLAIGKVQSAVSWFLVAFPLYTFKWIREWIALLTNNNNSRQAVEWSDDGPDGGV